MTAALAGLIGGIVATARPRPLAPWAASPDPPEGLPPARVLRVPGHGELFFREADGPSAAAPTVLLLHGWMFPADLNWFTTFGPLAEVARVIAPDHRGHGRGTRPTAPFRLVDVADDAAALVRQLGTGPVVVVGYSMGGPVAQLLWQRHPDVVRGLVCCATAATFSDSARDRWVWRTMGVLQVGLRLLPRFWLERLIQAQLDGRLPFRVSRMLHDQTPAEVKALLPWFIGELDRDSAEDVAEAGRELGRYDARGWLPSLDVPAAVLITTRDGLIPLDRQRDLAARLPGAVVYELPLDHDAPAAAPELFTSTLCKAVQQVLDAAE
jgi:pimeloyl-ACP methyl ester carboxylesterase